MKTIKVFEVGEEVYIKARVAQVIFDKDRISYELTDGADKFKHRFQKKDLKSVEELEGGLNNVNKNT